MTATGPTDALPGSTAPVGVATVARPSVPGTGSGAGAEVADDALARRLQDGDAAAGEALARRHYGPLIRYLHRLTGSHHLAEELHQQAWVSVLEHVGRFDAAAGGFKAWLFRIATNKANDHWRTRGRERVATDALRQGGEPVAPAADHRLESAEQQAKLRRAIDQLPETQRQVLMLRYYGGLKFAEIAAVLGCPLNTALGRMFKANQRLRHLMEQPEPATIDRMAAAAAAARPSAAV